MAAKFTPIKEQDLAAALGARLKAARAKAGLSVEKMADAAQVARRSYLEWEHGRTLPRLDSLLALSNFHKIPVEILLGGES